MTDSVPNLTRRIPLLLALSAGACAPSLVAVGPETTGAGTNAARATSDDGAQLVAIADSWDFEPRWLARHATPIEVVLTNESASDIEVQYDHFVLIDDAERVYELVSPWELALALAASEPSSAPTSDGVSLLAVRSPPSVHPGSSQRVYYSPRSRPYDYDSSYRRSYYRYQYSRHPTWSYGSGWSAPYSYGYYSPHLWAGYGPGYGDGWGLSWSYPGGLGIYYYDDWDPYWRVQRSYDTRDMETVIPSMMSGSYAIFEMSLREGRLRAGGRTAGFIFFPEIADDARGLSLLWTPVLHEPQQSPPAEGSGAGDDVTLIEFRGGQGTLPFDGLTLQVDFRVER